jgi:hypothetical protein
MQQQIDLTRDDDDAPSAPKRPIAAASPREEALLLEIAALKQLVNQRPASTEPQGTLASRTAALVDFLSDARSSASEVDRFLSHFPVAAAAGARVFYEALVDDVQAASLASILAKLAVLQRYRIRCPREVWRMQTRVESMEMQASLLGQEDLGRLLAALFVTMDPAPPGGAEFLLKLDGADLLLVAKSLAERGILRLPLSQQRLLAIVHYARHSGPLSHLREALRGSESLVNGSHNGFPILFQPLIELRSGWLERLRLLLQAGAEADVVYAPWNCSALHMLVYNKTGGRSRPAESALVEATRMLLEKGATRVLNRLDIGSSSGVKQRTALMQAASDGRFAVCTLLLQAGADADLSDSQGQTVLDLLFYLKHSHLHVHRIASAGYSCMDLYGLVNRFGLQGLVDEELREDCRGCGTCRYLLASVEVEEEEEVKDESDRMQVGGRMLLQDAFERLRL